MPAETPRSLTLGDVLVEERERVAVEPDGGYPIAGVYGFGRGVLLREAVRGADISASHLYRISAGQIIYSRLKAFEGAFALVPETADGRYVSNEFPTFRVDEMQALPAFIAMILSLPTTWSVISERIMGVGARRERLQVPDFLAFELELPSLDEQRRIVAAVSAAEDVVAAASAEADAADRLAAAIYRDMVDDERCETVGLGDVAALDIDRVAVVADGRYPIAGVQIAGEGLFRRETISGANTNYPRLHRLCSGQLVYRKLTAWEGPITVVPEDFEGAFVSPEFPTFTLDEARLHPEFMRFVCKQGWFHLEMRAGSTGTAERRNRLKPEDLLAIEMPLPSLDDQRSVAAASTTALALRHEAGRARLVATALRDEFFASGADELVTVDSELRAPVATIA